jgi:hypothetical protein
MTPEEPKRPDNDSSISARVDRERRTLRVQTLSNAITARHIHGPVQHLAA